jgi:prepilin-type N-terminal cleavage/methylation domain-containing protein
MAHARVTSEDGFTLVEVMVAIVVLLVGVLGTVMMIDGANAETSQTKAREGGTALARTVLEIARAVPYDELTAARVIQELDARDAIGLDDADAVTTGHQVSSRGFTYTVAPTVCSMDDPKDSLGVQDVGVAFCANSDVRSGTGPIDRNPDDYRRMEVELTWRSGSGPTETVTQTGIVTNPVGGLGPSVTSFTPKVPATATITSAATTEPSYTVKTSKPAADVVWAVNGEEIGSATGDETAWELSWSLGPADTPAVYDCTYVLQATALDADGRAGAPKALTVNIDRRVPFAPTSFTGGLNLSTGVGGVRRVDLQWDANRECDIQSYKVYRGVGGGAIDEEVCAVQSGEATECLDDDAPPASSGALQYQVVAFDDDPAGGDRSAVLDVLEGNASPPDAPTGFAICTGGNPDCNDIDGNPAPAGTAVLGWTASTDPDGDEIAFYRVYRGGNTYGDRLDVLFPVVDKPLVFVDSTVSAATSYYVSAVDEHFGESALTGPMTWGTP